MTPIEREKRTLLKMVKLYCRRHHQAPGSGLCIDCSLLVDYAFERLDKCPEGECKPSCRQCTHHCYTPARRKHVALVMRYSGPRMIFHHPIAALRHLMKEVRPPRPKSPRKPKP
ncbi:MAG: nitrous oxide-stimulated promoter family protein [Paramuribaculum sp.]|nr:nitrous oxide-stimulated promoter family protein [Paramuribaculum sp.]